MSHRKVCSQGSIPFSWEDSPGVSKITHQDYPTDRKVHINGVKPVSSPAGLSLPKAPSRSLESSTKALTGDIKLMVPLPPCPNLQPPRRSTSLKGYRWWQDDPFFAAYKECTKSGKSGGEVGSENKTSVRIRSMRKTKLMFSCKNSCDVKEDNVVRSKLPLIPSDHRVRGKQVANYMDFSLLN